jgi:uncharacterized protein (UPF0335 family)
MTNTALSGNRHPVDRLADVRAEIKKLQDEETDLKEQIGKLMGSADSLGGDEFIARQTLQERKGGLDEKALCRFLNADNLDAYRKPATAVLVLRVERREAEAA